jgi:HpaII restriction endonuclease
MLSGNKGGWSEIYVFLKLLAEGKVHAADAHLNEIPNVYYPIIKILREEGNKKRGYLLDSSVKVIDEAILQALFSVPVSEFALKAQALFQDLQIVKGRAFSLPHMDSFLDGIDVNMLSATNKDKADIWLVVHDLYTGMQPQLGFSIKSMLGKDATLFNASQATNFIYELIGDGLLDIAALNKIVAAPKITNRINAIQQQGFKLQFVGNQSKMLKLNLQLIDGDLPKILAELLLIRYQQGISSISELIQQLTLSNPLDYDLSEKHPFYAYKIKNFLTDAALGMVAARLWTGHYDATGGIIIVKENGDLVCYHIYNRNEFQTYLMDNTKHEQASTKKHGFGDVYEENGKYFIKLNLQIRFN